MRQVNNTFHIKLIVQKFVQNLVFNKIAWDLKKSFRQRTEDFKKLFIWRNTVCSSCKQ